MFSPLLIIAISSLLCLLVGWVGRWAGVSRVVALLGVAGALGVALWREGIDGAGVLGRVIEWPQVVSWLGEPIYRTDSLSAGLGSWCLVLGLLCLLKMSASGEAAWRLAAASAAIGVLYSLVHTSNLLAYAGQTFLLVMLVWVYRAGDSSSASSDGSLSMGRAFFALGAGAIMLLGAAFLIGRATGGDYDLVRMSLSALTVWPLILLAGFAIGWLGLLPFTGWGAEGRVGAHSALVQTLVVGLPVLVLILRLQALVSAQALVGTLPGEWRGFTLALQWLGGLTALVSAAGLLVWAGKERWSALLTAHAMGLALWGLGLDTPPGRYAALAILLAYGVGRITLELYGNGERTAQRGVAMASLAALPCTAGFIGAWLLGSALSDAERPTLVVALAGIIIVAACGLALELALSSNMQRGNGNGAQYVHAVGIAACVAIVIAGVAPGLWLPFVGSITSIAGGVPNVATGWWGVRAGVISAPVLLLLAGALAVWAIGWIAAAATRAPAVSSGALLPTALERIEESRKVEGEGVPENQHLAPWLNPLLANPPTALKWLSLSWLDAALMRIAALLGGLGTRSGRLLGTLEGRFYLPLALILALLIVLAITR